MSKTISNVGRISLLSVSLAIAATLSGCAQNKPDEQVGELGIISAEFTNTYWKLVELNDDSVSMSQNQEKEQHVIFHTKDSRFNGFAGCNRFFGQYEITDSVSTPTKVATTGNLILSGIGATRMACPDGLMDEQVYMTAISESTTYTIAGEILVLSDESGKKRAKFTAVYL